MPEGTEEQRAQIIAHLERLNSNVERQMSLAYGLRNGVIYGLVCDRFYASHSRDRDIRTHVFW